MNCEARTNSAYRELLNASDIALMELDDDFRVTVLNHAVLRLLSAKPTSVFKKHIWELSPPSQQWQFRDHLRGTQRPNRIDEIGVTLIGDEQTYVPVLLKLLPFEDSQNRRRYAAILKDIRAEAILANALVDEEKHQVLEQLPVYILHKSPNLCFTYGNQRFCDRNQIELDDLRGLDDYKLYPNDRDLAEQFRADDLWVIRHLRVREIIEFNPLGRESNRVPVQVLKAVKRDSDGNVEEIRCVFWELTDREEVLKATQRLYTSVVESVPFCLWRKNTEGRITFATKAFVNDLGFDDPKAVIGRTDFDFHDKELAQEYWQDDLRVLRDGERIDKEERHQPHGRPALFVRVMKMPIYDVTGRRIIGLQGAFWDNARSERGRMWRELFFGAAHKLGNPVFRIQTNLNSLRHLVAANKHREIEEVLDELDESVKTANRIIGEFKLLTRAQSVKLAKTELAPVLQDACKQAEQNGLTLSVVCPEHIQVWADEDQLKQVFDELVSNSLNWVPETDGGISVSASIVSNSDVPDLLKRSGERSEFIRILFNDNGPGVPPQRKREIFDPFFTNREDGAGLGLSIVRTIVERHSGVITECGNHGRGACFELFLRSAAGSKPNEEIDM